MGSQRSFIWRNSGRPYSLVMWPASTDVPAACMSTGKCGTLFIPTSGFSSFCMKWATWFCRAWMRKRWDEWAFKEYAKRGKSLKRVVHALIDVLAFHDPYGNPIWEHYERGNAQLERAKAWDLKLNQ